MSDRLVHGEVLTSKQLEDFAKTLAASHRVSQKCRDNLLLTRLGQNQQVLRNAYDLVHTVLRKGFPLSPAAEWLLDNFYLIDEQIRTARLHLPEKYNRELPPLDDGRPRIYVLAKEFISHTDGCLNGPNLKRFIAAYQACNSSSVLKIGELWATPIMLRLALIENLRHIAENIAAHYIDQTSARFWADRLVEISRTIPDELVIAIADLAKSKPRLSNAFVSEFACGIQAGCANPTLPLGWIEQQAAAHGLSFEQHQHLASQQHAHDQLSISNSICSLRFIDSSDWREFVESVSLVEQKLCQDPAGVYQKMDFLTRDTYRHVIEYSARYSRQKETASCVHNELAVADAAIELARQYKDEQTEAESPIHVGEFLLGKGRAALEARLNVKHPAVERWRRALRRHPLGYYFGSQALVIMLLTWWPLKALYSHYIFLSNAALALDSGPWAFAVERGPLTFLAVLGAFALILVSSSAASAIVNWATTLFLEPKPWPRFDYSKGVPTDCRAVVVIPSMLSSAQVAERLVSNLEIRYLGNQDVNIAYALLTDFVDAPSEHLANDEALLAVAQRGIERLNAKYLTEGHPAPFHLLHRPRLWNKADGVWMGRERKRGKLADLNSYLRARGADHFMNIIGDQQGLKGIRYVITLDADTVMPRDSARQLIATIAHPLNKVHLDQRSGIVRNGYAILQPRVTTHHQDAEASILMRLCSDDGGIDPYTKAVSDVYQDLFQEGSFIGKGIYDVDAFQAATGNRFPENRILSHDLIEGCFARCGLVTDIQLVEEYPTSYSADAYRRHRWMRGDWQIASWALPKIPNPKQDVALSDINPLSALSRWKVFDNLRRSLIPAAMVVVLAVAWHLGRDVGDIVTLAVVSYLLLPNCLVVISVRRRTSTSTSFSTELRELGLRILRGLAIGILSLAFLPYEAALATDAALRTAYRLIFSKHHLLEWCTAVDARQRSIRTPLGYCRLMFVSPVLAAITLAALSSGFYSRSLSALVISCLWLVAPLIAWWISRTPLLEKVDLTAVQRQFLSGLARRTWLFFEMFVTAEDHWLPPDNFQEVPIPVVAHRTSPTNIGLALLSTLGAYDFGYISLKTLMKRIDGAIQTLESLPRYKGHFFNWYDTLSLAPLNPYYISTVDSGNFAASIMILRQGLLGIAAAPQLHATRILSGLKDTWLVLKEVAKQHDDGSSTDIEEIERIIESALAKSSDGRAAAASDLTLVLQDIAAKMLPFASEASASALASPIALSVFAKGESVHGWREIFARQLRDHQQDLGRLIIADESEAARNELQTLARRANALTDQDYGFLYNSSNKLLMIGFNVTEMRQDNSYYDLLASEARLASFLGIATGSLPQEHWFALGRQLTSVRGSATLLSWSGSMFEYLMPDLFLPRYKGTLLDQASRLCVKRQIEYGNECKMPWGMSESGYNLMDAGSNYQYRAFGVPGLGFKRDLELDLVIAPYATVMALMIDPQAAYRNLKAMEKRGYGGIYGFYEAIDLTSSRLPPGVDEEVIRSFMAHHQGMGFLSLASLLLGSPMQQRMQDDPRFKATQLLLQERVPRNRPAFSHVLIDSEMTLPAVTQGPVNRIFGSQGGPDDGPPEAHLLGNGNFHTVVTSAGGGYSKWKDLLLTRWHEDGTRDGLGEFIYIREPVTGKAWSAAYQPTLVKAEHYAAIFSEGRAEFRRTDDDIDIHTEIAVSSDDDAEVRRVTIKNRSDYNREFEVTTYAEVVLSSLAADLAHPAFNKLFVETETVPNLGGILCHRRSRMPGEVTPWLCHAVLVNDAVSCHASFETDRAAFLGRNRSLISPVALTTALTGAAGAVLDPVLSIRQKIKIKAGTTVTLSCILGVAKDREHAIQLLERIQERSYAQRTMELASTHDYMMLRQINSTSAEAMLFGSMLSPLLYGGAAFRSLAGIVKGNNRPQSSLWGYGISGDLPIVLLRLESQGSLSLILLQQVVRAHAYWRRKGLAVDLVIWNEDKSGYRQAVHDAIMHAVAGAEAANVIDKAGGIFLRRPDQMPEEDRRLIQTVARIVLTDQAGSLAEQMKSKRTLLPTLPKAFPRKVVRRKDQEPAVENLAVGNEHGGFSPDGREYVLRLGANHKTCTPPAPWSNVMANPDFGTLVTESGASFTWSENAREHRLTPWSNDPITDPSGECLYIRDEVSGEVWSATPAPTPGNGDYTVVHGFGYTTFSTGSFGVGSELVQFVAHDAPVKIFLLKFRNHTKRQRKLSATLFLELVLGDDRSKTKDFIVTESEPNDLPNSLNHRAIFARNVYANDFASRTAFLTSTVPVRSITCDRVEFLGRVRASARPAAMDRVSLSGRVGALLDPCMAMQISIELAPEGTSGESAEAAFVFGCAKSGDEARALVKRFGAIEGYGTGRVRAALDGARNSWAKLLNAVQIETPDPSINLLSNGWLLYQTISSRIWGRTSFYQPGGAYGFRDQLQDVMAVVYAAPGIAREHILRCARHQFTEGDVQHWWHPPSGKGVRTRFSDDYLWLPYVSSQYICITGDFSILDEQIPFIEGPLLAEGQESHYGLPTTADGRASLYEHCTRALKRSFNFGAHGLPLMGAGDWNDGMNLVGLDDKGESVWLAFFLYDTLQRFAEVAKNRNDTELVLACHSQANLLKENINANAWDGSWYIRAFFGDGSAIGAAANRECRIDSLPQSWAVLSGAGDQHKVRIAMDAVFKQLVREEDGLVLLLTPPFDQATPTPGYIAGYLPGIRENGGQYTHAAIWVIMAFAQLGDYDRAMHLLTLIDPVRRGADPDLIQRYKVEPYVVAADVYSNLAHVGRGGWTWYTGAAAWYYRLVIETILGFELRGDRLRMTPKVPSGWNTFQIKFTYKGTLYLIVLERQDGSGAGQSIEIDGRSVSDDVIQLQDDGQAHRVKVRF